MPECIGADGLDHLVRVHDIAAALRHLFPIDGPPAVSEDGFRQRQVQGHEHRGPVDCVGGQNILTDEMDRGGPELIEGGLLREIFQS